jgi:hypothetical protein
MIDWEFGKGCESGYEVSRFGDVALYSTEQSKLRRDDRPAVLIDFREVV